MKSTEDQTRMIREQVNAKVIWGAGDREILDWLQERHGITDDEAHEFLAEACRAKRAAVRHKALWRLGFSMAGLLLVGGFIFLQVAGSFVVVGYGTVLLVVLGITSLGVFFRSLFQLLTGRNQGSVH